MFQDAGEFFFKRLDAWIANVLPSGKNYVQFG